MKNASRSRPYAAKTRPGRSSVASTFDPRPRSGIPPALPVLHANDFGLAHGSLDLRIHADALLSQRIKLRL